MASHTKTENTDIFWVMTKRPYDTHVALKYGHVVLKYGGIKKSTPRKGGLYDKAYYV